MADELEAHLKEHAQYFDGLLSLIPASLYYEQDRSDQWQRKKQTKEQAKAAKRAKLDPMNAKSVKDIMDEKAEKRKREEDAEEIVLDGVTLEQPGDGLKLPSRQAKKQRTEFQDKEESFGVNGQADASTTQRLKKERKEAKKERKAAAQAAKREEKRQRHEEKAKRRANGVNGAADQDSQTAEGAENDGAMESSEFGGLSESNPDASAVVSVASHSSKDHSPVFDSATLPSGTSSISSFPEPIPATADKPKETPLEPPPKATPEELKLRLQKRLAELRAARKADKEDGTPAITRQQLLEQRREKEAQRKAHKKALRKEAKEEERRKREEEIAQGSPLMSPSIGSPAGKHGQSPLSNSMNNFSFGRIAFENGQTMTSGLDSVVSAKKKTPPHHTKLALQAAERHKEKLAQMDPEKRSEAATKDMWIAAKKRAQGERVRDDTSLLKKTLKRKENQKKRSEKEWKGRLQAITQSQEARQKKREENLQKRREGKGVKNKKPGKKSKPKARAGFEGSFRAGGKRQ